MRRSQRPYHFTRSIFRKRLIESLESRCLLAADPVMLQDLNSAPDPAASSYQVDWDFPNRFLASVNNEILLGSTDSTGAGTFISENLGPHSGQVELDTTEFGAQLMHISDPATEATVIRWFNFGTATTLSYETDYLGSVADVAFLQRRSDNAILSVNWLSQVDQIAIPSGPLTDVLDSHGVVVGKVSNPNTGNIERWELRRQFFFGWTTTASATAIVSADESYLYDDYLYSTNATGDLVRYLEPGNFNTPFFLGNFGAKVQDVDFKFETQETSFLVYHEQTNTTDLFVVERLQPATLLHSFAGFASSIDEIGTRLVQVEAGPDEGYWWVDENDTIFRDVGLSKMTGPVSRVNSSLVGWSDFDGFGSEPAVYTPDPVIRVSNNQIGEAQSIGSSAGFLWLDWAAGQSVTWELVAGAGDTNNSDFTIAPAGNIFTTRSFDFETTPTASIRVRASGQFGTVEKVITIEVFDLLESISISNDRVLENVPDALIGSLSVQNFPPDELVSYSIVSGSVDEFQIVGNQFRTATGLDFEAQSFYNLTVRASTTSGVSVEWPIQIFVDNVNENAQSAITITSDSILEESLPGTVIGDLGVRNQSGAFSYALVDGNGGADNFRFEIVDGTLRLLEQPNFEAARSYTVRIEATQGELIVTDYLTIDVLPVDEYLIEGIDFVGLDQGLFSFFDIAENTPVGTHVMTLRAQDPDQGETYSWSISGGLTQYLRLEGDRLYVNAPINYEAITDFFALDFSATATPRVGNSLIRTQPGGITENSTHFHTSIVDVNDPPVVSSISNQTAQAGDETALLLSNPLFTDEDSPTFTTFSDSHTVELFQGNDPAPSWMQLDVDAGVLRVNPAFSDAGLYHLTLRVTDASGAIDETNFDLNISSVNATFITGTSENDSFVVRPNNANGTTWTVLRNNQVVYSGISSLARPLAIDGIGGNDSIVIEGSQRGNNFTVNKGSVVIDSSRIYQLGVESREIRGRAGADRFQLTSTLQSIPTSIVGGTGRDVLIGPAGDVYWTVSGNGSGQVGDVQFSGFSELQGGPASDTFAVDPAGRMSMIQGGGGVNRIDYLNNSTAVSVNVSSLTGRTGTATRVDDFTSINGFSSPFNFNNRISYSNSAVSSSSSAQWDIYYDQVKLSSGSSVPVEFMGFLILEGSNRNDSFNIDYVESEQYQLLGRGGQNTVFYRSMFGYVDLENRVGHGVREFRDVDQFLASSQGGSVAGQNQATQWLLNNGVVQLSTGEEVLGFTNLYGGSEDDRFVILNSPEYTAIEQLYGGAGSNSLDYSLYGTSVYVNLDSAVASGATYTSDFSIVYGSVFDDILIGASYQDDYLFGLAGNDTLDGLDGNDALFGGLGDDTILGGDGRDWLVGGLGADQLDGQGGEDILIACAAPTFEGQGTRSGIQLARIDSVMGEWTSSRTYSQRVQRLSNGTGGLPRLSASTLSNDNRVDRLTGGSELDWFWAANNDVIEDRANGETRSQI